VLFGDISAHQPNAEIRLFGELAADTVGDLGAQFAALIRTGHRQLVETDAVCRRSRRAAWKFSTAR